MINEEKYLQRQMTNLEEYIEWKKTKNTNNMETKKKINWKRVWQIVRDFILGLLTADSIRNL